MPKQDRPLTPEQLDIVVGSCHRRGSSPAAWGLAALGPCPSLSGTPSRLALTEATACRVSRFVRGHPSGAAGIRCSRNQTGRNLR
jgi:hypothetical protein